MINKIKISFFFILSLFLFTGVACKPKECFSKASPENKDNQSPKVVREKNAQYKKALNRHLKQQTPETRKRIKQNLKQQQQNYKAGQAY